MKRAAALLVLALLSACAEKLEIPEKLELSPLSFENLPGWQEDKIEEALPALLSSCAVWNKREATRRFAVVETGKAGDWQAPCAALEAAVDSGEAGLRAVLTRWFIPYRVTNQKNGLFTGYYEASLRGATTRGGAFQTPLWTRPDDMLNVDLGAFRESWKGQKITGKIDGKNFVPYDPRALIARGSLDGRAKPLVFVDDSVDAFFLEVQGSGRVEMADGSVMRIGYDAQNGHGYTPIGRVLAQRGEIERPVTMQKIRAWLAAHPERAQEIMNENPSVVFFRKLDRDGPVGAQGVVLTPLRSLAVDPHYVPLGVPLWLSTEKHHRLVVAQDTGGAIKGPVRGDLFWGFGEKAERGAGEMQEQGTYYLILPKETSKP